MFVTLLRAKIPTVFCKSSTRPCVLTVWILLEQVAHHYVFLFYFPLHYLYQALAGNPNEENRAVCSAATGPLMEAVDELVTFSSSPEFASVPAQISPSVSSSS